MRIQGVKTFYKSELTVAESGARGKSLLGIILSIIVLMIISSMIVAAIVLINPEIANFTSRQHASREAITLEEALLGELAPKEYDFHWLPARSGANEITNDKELEDQLLFEDSKNINIVTMPPSERRQASSSTLFNGNNQQQQQQQSQNFQPNTTTLISNSSLLSSIEYQGYKLSPSQRYLLIWTTKKKQFRHSFTAKYFIYDIKLDLISSLSTVDQHQTAANEASSPTETKYNQFDHLDSASLYLNDHLNYKDHAEEKTRFQAVDWFEFGTNDKQQSAKQQPPSDSLILIQNNDIYLLANVTEMGSLTLPKGQNVLPKRLTFTGKLNEIFNGVPDWLYEEEILGDASAFQVSPNGSKLAYLSFNDSLVDSMPFPIYSDLIIPKIQNIKYPKTGRPNPTISIHVIENLHDDQKRRDVKLILPDTLDDEQHYIARINWLTDEKLAMIWINRYQNLAHILLCSQSLHWNCEKNLQLNSEGGWLDIFDDLHPLDDEHYLALLPKFEGPDVGNFKHLAKVSMTKPNDLVYITSGCKDVLSINRVDSKRSLVYYTSTVINEPGQRQLFVAELVSGAISVGADHRQQFSANKVDGLNAQQPSQPDNPSGISVCITCDHYPTECLFNYAQVSPSGNYYIFHCEGPGVPRTELRATRRRRHRLLQQNQSLGLNISPNGLVAASINETNGILQQLASSLPASPSTTNNIKSADFRSNSSNRILVNDTEGVADQTAGGQSENLLWNIEDNKELRKRLEFGKAMPLKMRLRVPIANTNYSANVVLLLPPQLSPTANFKSMPSSQQSQTILSNPIIQQLRLKRGALPSGGLFGSGGQLECPALHGHYTPKTIKDYISQLPVGQQYPMVVDVYAGPGSQRVDYRFNIDFGHYLASSRRTIYAMIDGRGSGYQGTKRLYEIYHKLGTVEIQDQIDVAAFLSKNLSFIDPTKVAIWGWSYGGYASAMALAQSNAQAMQTFRARLKSLKTNPRPDQATPSDLINQLQDTGAPSLSQLILSRAPGLGGTPQLHGVFECAASVAPVTNWIYYDTTYTERFMSSPWQNELFDKYVANDHREQHQRSNDINGLSSVVSKNQQQPPLEHYQQPWIPQTMNTNKWISLNGTVPSGPLSRVSAMPNSGAGQIQSSMRRMDAINNSSDLNERYRRASLLEHIGDIDRKRFLLIHGTADDNVHFQQSIMLMKKLIQKNVLFETRLYPDQDHSIANRADKLHLASTLSSFFAECFDMAY